MRIEYGGCHATAQNDRKERYAVLAFEEVGSEIPVTAGPHRPRQPQNLDFSQP
jgi:hypothetical protein